MSFDYMNRAWIRECRTSLKKTSLDDENDEFMTESPLNVISFDRLKESYLRQRKLSPGLANSVDAMSSDGEDTYLIEFKNGQEIDSHQIENKLKDSVVILCDEWHRTISDTRKDIVFVLVYNEKHRKMPALELRAIAMANKSGVAHTHFGLGKANLYVKKALIYNKNEFSMKLLPLLRAN